MERRLLEAVRIMNGELLTSGGDRPFHGAALDSRRIRGGELFFALPGERTDGHRFVAQALTAGAAAAVVERRYLRQHPLEAEAWSRLGPVVAVDDGLEALHGLSREVRRSTPRKLVGITGSAGKTTTKEILATLLGGRFRVARSPGNFNSLYGFPLALLDIPADTEWMVAEMGMSEPGELGRLSRLAKPDVAVLTNIGSAHLERFGRIEAIAEAKAEILQGLPPEGLVVANADDPLVMAIGGRHAGPIVTYGRSPEAIARGIDVRGLRVQPGPGGDGSRLELEVKGASHEVRLPLHGSYNVDNFLAAAACAWALGVPAAEIAARAGQIEGGSGRGRLLRLEGPAVVIDDSYNSNPEAAVRALESALALPAERHWAVLGEMLELGEAAPALHEQVGRRAASLGFSPVVGVGPLGRPLLEGAKAAGAAVRWFETAAAAAAWVQEELRAGDVLLVKGSRGVGLEAVVQALVPPGGGV
jgi:UDP-N-acetylmuramoyl-tripeptide--D-alanyl-D-alanine ligase